MPVSYEIDAARGVVRITIGDEFTAAEAVALLERLASDPLLSPGMSQLVDLTRMTTPPTVAESENLASALARLRGRFEGARCAVIVAHPAMYGAIRQLAALAARAGVEVRPFNDQVAAGEWLCVGGRRAPNDDAPAAERGR